MKAPFGMAATRLRNRSWVAGEVGKRKRTEVPSFMGSQSSMPLDAAASPGRSSVASSDPARHEEARDEERLQGDGLGPAHDGARRSLGALSRRAVQEVRASVPALERALAESTGHPDRRSRAGRDVQARPHRGGRPGPPATRLRARSEEHTSELQSRLHLVCRLLLEKKKKHIVSAPHIKKRQQRIRAK